jgi:hypothetical protein
MVLKLETTKVRALCRFDGLNENTLIFSAELEKGSNTLIGMFWRVAGFRYD